MARALRRAVDAVGLLAGAGAVLVFAFVGYRQYSTQQKVEAMAASLREFDRTLAIQSVSRQVEVTNRGWPITVDPGWFQGDIPRNLFMPIDSPWLEVATEDQAHLQDPPARVAPDRKHAGFWYNPYQGIVRARVPLIVSEARSIDLYNRINGRFIATGFEPHLHVPAAAASSDADDSQSEQSMAGAPTSGGGGPD